MTARALAIAVAVMVAAQLADLGTFLAAMAAGVPIGEEANPVARAQYLAGPLGAIAPKLLVLGALLAVIYVLHRWDAPKQALLLAVCGAAVGLVGAVCNGLTLIVWVS
jgi:hypothetical protein